MLQYRRALGVAAGLISAWPYASYGDDWSVRQSSGIIEPIRNQIGDQIPDFSEAGYGSRGQAIPKGRIVEQVGFGDGRAIQAAIDKVSAMPMNSDGLRGVILLAPHRYLVAEPIVLKASGVILRGQRIADERTKLEAINPIEKMIVIGGKGRLKREGQSVPIVQSVRVGSRSIQIDNPQLFQVGDEIVVEKPFTQRWLRVIGMDRIPPRSDGKPVKQWTQGTLLRFERRIVGISNENLQLDAPIMETLDVVDQPTVWRASFAGRISHVGVEAITAVGSSQPLQRNGKVAADTFIVIDNARDAWMGDIVAENFATFVEVGRGARDITIDGFKARNIGASRSPYPPGIFSISGQRTLIQNCSYEGNNAHVWTTQSLAAGPNVFRKCKARGDRIDGGPHQRWSSGTLYEQLNITGQLIIRNRSNMGSGQGWAGTSNVVWNSKASEGLMLEQAPGNYNWAFGFKGPLIAAEANQGTLKLVNETVEPLSLYDAQLRAHYLR